MYAWMGHGLQYLIAIVALLILAPFVAWAARGLGGKVKGGLVLGSILLGFGEVVDPPSKHLVEAMTEPKGSPEKGEPPLPDEDQPAS